MASWLSICIIIAFFDMILSILSFFNRSFIHYIIIAVIVWFMYLVSVNNKTTEIYFYNFHKISPFVNNIMKLFIDFKLFLVYNISVQILN